MLLAQFRQRYPQGSIVSELVDIDRSTYIVKVSISVEQIVLATGLAGAERVEIAEDLARERAIAALILDNFPATASTSPLVSSREPAVISSPPSTNINNYPSSSKATVAESPVLANNTHNNSNNRDLLDLKPNQKVESATTSSDTKINGTTAPIVPVAESSSPATTQPEATSTTDTFNGDQPSTPGNLFEGTYNPEIDLEGESPETISTANTAATEATTDINATEEVDLSDFDFMQIKQKTDLEIERLGWTKDYGREFLKSHYGKRTRLHLTNEELLEFLQYLESQPTPS